jgi:pSer/pThr/pTyr-binding forkhead associated (FHA) protein
MDSANKPMLKVSGIDGQYDEYPLQQGVNLIGRYSNDINMAEDANYVGIKSNDTKISRKHFIIDWRQNGKGEQFLILSDNISANGTILKGYKNQHLFPDDKIFLVHNDEIIIGDTSIFVHIPLTLQMVKAVIIERTEENIKTLTWRAKRPL